MTITLVSSHAVLLCLQEPTSLHASFSARFEHEIRITRSTREPVATLESTSGPQSLLLDPGCYTVENWYTPEETWYPGKAKVFSEQYIGWEDAADDDFNDAIIVIGDQVPVLHQWDRDRAWIEHIEPIQPLEEGL